MLSRHDHSRFASTLFLLLFVSAALSSQTIFAQEKGHSSGKAPMRLAGVSNDPKYGVTSEKPIRVGGGFAEGSANQIKYLQSLRGPNGEKIKFKRTGSCCMFVTPNGIQTTTTDGKTVGVGLLDQYEVTYKGLDKPIVLYLDLYDYETPQAPMGFTVGTYEE